MMRCDQKTRLLLLSFLVHAVGAADPVHPAEGTDPPDGMVAIPGGTFYMGGDAGLMDGDSQSHRTAYPIQTVTVDPFWMDETEVTNAEFARFVEATGYVTFAERPLPPDQVEQLKASAAASVAQLEQLARTATGGERDAIEAKIEQIKRAATFGDTAGSIVFAAPEVELYDENDYTRWWTILPGASWRAPEGPGSSWRGREDHPVVNVTRADAAAYAAWAGKRLPTEAEWERAARGGLDRKPFAWGEVFQPNGEGSYMANTWQGPWPYENSADDGFVTTAPVKRFPPNPFGLYDIAGNVWEIVADVYHPSAYRIRGEDAVNPQGPDPERLRSYGLPTSIHVIRGGSFLCSDSWCSGYKPGSRQSLEADSPAFHAGFRCVKDFDGEAAR